MSLLANPVIWSVLILMGLSLARMNVVLALLCAALVAGLGSGLDLTATLSAFSGGLGGGANIALSYALLGAARRHRNNCGESALCYSPYCWQRQ